MRRRGRRILGAGGIIGVVAVAAVIVTFWWRPAWVGGEVSKATDRSEAANGGGQRTGSATRAAAPTDASGSAHPIQVTPFAESRVATTGALAVRVTWHDGTPAAGVVVSLRQLHVGTAFVRLATDQDGVARVDGLTPARIMVATDRGAEVEATVGAGTVAHADVTIPRGLDVRGLVVDDAALPIAFARVFATSGATADPSTAICLADGTFSIRDLAPDRMLCATAPGYLPSEAASTRGVPGTAVDVRIVLAKGGGSVRGRVLSSDDHGVAGARVMAGGESRTVRFEPDRGLIFTWGGAIALTDESGAFAFESVEPGPTRLMAAAKDGGVAVANVTVAGGETTAVDLHLTRGSTVRGTVRDQVGTPIAGAWIDTGEDGLDRRATQSDARGTFELTEILAGAHILEASAGVGTPAKTTLTLDGVGDQIWDPVIWRGLRCRVRLVGDDDAPLVGWLLYAEAQRGSGLHVNDDRSISRATTTADGRAVMENLAPVSYLLFGSSPGTPRQFVAVLCEDLRPTEEERVIRVTPPLVPDCRIIGCLQGPDGTPIGGASVMVLAGDARFSAVSTVDELRTHAESGAIAITGVPPGAARIVIAASGFAPWRSPAHVLQPHEAWDLGVIRLPSAGTLAVTVHDEDGERFTDDVYLLAQIFIAPSRRVVDLQVLAAGHGRFRLAPGDYEVSFKTQRNRTPALRTASAKFTIRAGEETTLDLRASITAGIEVLVESPSLLNRSDFPTVIATDDAGRVAGMGFAMAGPGGAWSVVLGLQPGRFKLEASTESGQAGDAEVVVPELGGALPVVTIRLR